ncbi:hypothetical protein SLU01_27210 [Sporosarcina luteola]|uniref:Uncharacterized protein n=1 Tax=Sporosarcina luteola TaxID=582850 RepID=A0A511ZAD3_9BACL|nr:hypothetical protein SLU01_27210 [Sporosarcina luteola]
MFIDYYGSFKFIFVSFVIWWTFLFVFQRMAYRFTEKRSWVKDIVLTFLQTAFVIVTLPVLAYFMR